MFSEDDLDDAVAAGVLSVEAARGFRAFLAGHRGESVADEEHFRLLTGFNDIFVSIAALLILVAIGKLGGMISPVIAGLAVAVASWAGAEYFTRRRRMALPSIVLLISFVFGAVTFGIGLSGVFGGSVGMGPDVAICGALMACVATYAHWRRFMVPLTVAAGTGSALATLMLALVWFFPALRGSALLVPMFIGGLAVFALAMVWDATDRHRKTRRSDVAFWLHLSAAPLIVHPAFTALGIMGGAGGTLWHAAAAVAIYFVLALVALAVDRRALLVSALGYVLYAMSVLLHAAGSLSESFALTALVIGSVLLLLSAFWQWARRLVVCRLPCGLQARLPVV